MEYRIIVPASGSYKINFRVASQPGGGKIGFSVNGANLSTTDIATTGGWQNWKTISSVVNLNKGTQLIRLTALSGGWNINWFNIEVDNSVGIAEPKTENNKIEIYPNPTTDTINIQIAKPSKITIYDINGRKVYTTQSKVKVLKIPSCEIGSKGVYLVNTNSGTQKLIIN